MQTEAGYAQKLFREKLKRAVEEQTAVVITRGSNPDHGAYQWNVGIIEGLKIASELMSEAEAQAQKASRG